MKVKLTVGVVVRMIDKEKREGQCKARHLRRWSMGGVTGPKLCLAQRSNVRKKNTLKMKPHQIRKPFPVAVGHSIKTVTILQSLHKHQNNYTQHTAIRVTPSSLRLNK